MERQIDSWILHWDMKPGHRSAACATFPDSPEGERLLALSIKWLNLDDRVEWGSVRVNFYNGGFPWEKPGYVFPDARRWA